MMMALPFGSTQSLATAICRTRSWPLHPFDGDGPVIGRATSCCPSRAKHTTPVASYDTGEIARRADTSCARYEAIAGGERALEELQTQPPNLEGSAMPSMRAAAFTLLRARLSP